MNHLEKLVRQYYDWQGYLVKGNIKVGKLSHGGWAGELDVVAYHPISKHLVHVEPSISGISWNKMEVKLEKKFSIGRRYIRESVFPWLSDDTRIDQIALLVGAKQRNVGEASIMSLDEFMRDVKNAIQKQGIMGKNAIAEEFDLLRTIQLAINGYRKLAE